MLLLLLLDNKLRDARKTLFRHLTSNYSTWALPTGGGGGPRFPPPLPYEYALPTAGTAGSL